MPRPFKIQNHLLGILLTLAPITTLHSEPVLNEMGELQLLLENTVIPSAASLDKYRLPTEPELTAFRSALAHLLDGDLQAAADAAVTANYDVVSYTDTVSNDVFALLRDKNSNPHWGGLYAVDLTPERALVIQCPHPLYDGVRVPAADIFLETNATAYLQAGTHRNNSPIESDCDGDLGGAPYRISDMAHAPDSFFQAAHEVIEQHFTRSVSLSFHGMAEDSDPADIVVSNGTPYHFFGNSLSRALASRMNQILADAADSRIAVSHQEPGEDPALSGSTNTQGRFTNGSTDLCHLAAPTAIFPERFIHMECDPDIRDGAPANWAFVIQALTELIPFFSAPETDTPQGDLAITEFMPNPNQVGDASGEYLELFNQTGSPIDMSSWTIVDHGENRATFSGIIQPGDLFVVGVSSDLNGAAPDGAPDAVWQDTFGDLTLTNSGDTIYLLDDQNDLVASVTYEDGSLFGAGVAFELAEGNQHRNGQTSESDYLASETTFAADLGSPGTRGASSFPLPALHPVPSLPGNDFALHFTSVPAVTYTLSESPDLDAWSEAQEIPPFIGDGSPANFIFSRPGVDRYFYSIQHDYAAPYSQP